MLWRIRPFDAGPQNRDRAAAGLQRALMRRAVDTARHAAYDGKSEGSQTAREIARHPPAKIAGAARPNDRYTLIVFGLQRTLDIEERRRVGESARSRRIFRRSKPHNPDVRCTDGAVFFIHSLSPRNID